MKRIIFFLFFSSFIFSQEEVKFTLHNLSISGPGNIKSSTKEDICGFCHTPHSAEPKVPLWGHQISTSSYKIYFSKTLDSFLKQPSNQSKLCLSCHDGTIALWDKGNEKIKLDRSSKGYIGLDLSGSHPVSFSIDDSIIFLNNQKDSNLKSLSEIKKEFNNNSYGIEFEMECTTCHDPHKNIYADGEIPFGKRDKFNNLCLSCHIPSMEKHNNPAIFPKECKTCHKAHGVQQTPLLQKKEPDLCFKCHGSTDERNSSVREGLLLPLSNPKDINSSFLLNYTHNLSEGCTVCHKIHSPDKPREYEVCGECHSDLEFYSNPASTHPVLQMGKGKNILKCSSCHNGGEFNPSGVHGSKYKGIIFENYEMEDGVEESDKSYKFCYTCHKREDILSFDLHKKHIVFQKTSCFTCHLSHGSRNYPYLLSFEDEKRRDRIKPTSEGLILYQKLGEKKGICYLNCHNFEHNGLTYGLESNLENLKKLNFNFKKMKGQKGRLKKE